MSKKERPDPFTEGHIRTIYELFFAPLIGLKPMQLSLRDWMETLFDLSARSIHRYVAKRPITLPGLYCEQPFAKIQGVGPRHLNAGDEVLVRVDERNPDDVTLEHSTTVGGAPAVFSLTASEWGRVQLDLELADRAHIREQQKLLRAAMPKKRRRKKRRKKKR